MNQDVGFSAIVRISHCRFALAAEKPTTVLRNSENSTLIRSDWPGQTSHLCFARVSLSHGAAKS